MRCVSSSRADWSYGEPAEGSKEGWEIVGAASSDVSTTVAIQYYGVKHSSPHKHIFIGKTRKKRKSELNNRSKDSYREF